MFCSGVGECQKIFSEKGHVLKINPSLFTLTVIPHSQQFWLSDV